ncbi:hypothetical protein B9Z65_2034 [Elsinoe australis]|uniref:Uncharacterized protein n=1 Tax=Elsinoe australis TaxID=40998 RepID=A0A2P7YMV6_9PEZI|nr:hypothetical protein B9Z65_2034 [Elsinoe australis]
MRQDPFKPAARVAGQRQDVWSIVNEAAGASTKPVVNLGQGFFGYNPPKFVLDAAKGALDRVECNQYSPTKGRPRLKKAIADAYSPFFGRTLNPETEVTITTGANEGMLSAFMGFLEQGDEVIVFEPFFDQYISNIEMPGGKCVYVPLQPPKEGSERVTKASEWKLDIKAVEAAITDKTRMIVLNSPHNPVGKVFSREELQAIGDLCVKHNIIILSDEVYDRLYYVPFTRMATLSPEIAKLTLTVGSGGKNFYCTGWRVGWLIGPEHLIKYVSAAHTRICFSSVSPLQEATAIGFEEADNHGFWDETKKEMKGKMELFNEIWDELGLPYSKPDGGYFVLVNLSKVQLPEGYDFPPHVANRPRDFKLCWFMIKELGIAAIPPTEFFTDANAHIVEDWMRFAVCKDDAVLEDAKERLRGLKNVRLHIASYYSVLSFILLILVLRRIYAPIRNVLDAYISKRTIPSTALRFTFGGLLLISAIALLLGGSLGYFTRDQLHSYRVRAIAAEDNTNGYMRLAAVGFTGHLTDVLMGLIILPVSRTSVLSRVLHLSPSSLLTFHQLVGYLFFLAVVLHTIFFYSWVPIFARAPQGSVTKEAFAIDNPTITQSESLRRGPYSMSVLASGMLAFIIFVAIIITSLPYARRKRYNTFYITHAFSILFFILTCLHASTDFYMLLPGLLLWLLDWSLRVRGLGTGVQATLQGEGNGWYRIQVPIDSLSSGTAKAIKSSLRYPLQSWYLNVPAVSKWQIHPFTPARQHAGTELRTASSHERIVFLWRVPNMSRQEKKQAKEWTTRLTALIPEQVEAMETNEISAARTSPTTQIRLRLEGPYPLSHRPFEAYSHVLCVVGGTGITGALTLAEMFIERCRDAKTISEVAVSPFMTTKMTILWTLKEAEDADLADVRHIKNLARQVGADLVFEKHLTGPERQRLDVAASIKHFLDESNGEKSDMQYGTSTWVYFSGPSKLMEAGEAACFEIREGKKYGGNELEWYSARWDV